MDSHKKVEDAFRRLGIYEQCAICGNGPKGGCCLKEAETWYEPICLIINMLFGVRLGITESKEKCSFLGESGCILIYKNEFCLNFFCDHLIGLIGIQNIRHLRSLVGKELQVGLRIEDYLRIFLTVQGPSNVNCTAPHF